MVENEIKNIIVKSEIKDNYLQVLNYEYLQNALTDFLAKQCYKDLIIDNDVDLKIVKEKRADLNRLVDSIRETRLNTTKALTGLYESQVKALEKQIEQTSKTLSQNIKDYQNTKEIEKQVEETSTQPKVYTLTIHSFDKKTLKEIEKLAKEKNLKCELKENK